MAIKIVKANKRKPGERAGMSRSKIVSAATLIWAEEGPDRFTIRKLARKLKVGPTTVHGHFKGGLPELRREIARSVLAERTPPYKPKQDAKGYLFMFFRDSLAAFRDEPNLGRLVALELTDNPILSLPFAERMGATFRALKKNVDVISALELFISRWTGLILLEIGAWAQQDPDAAKTALQTRLISVSAVEFPTLKAAPQTLGASLGKRASTTYLEKAAGLAATAFLSDLASGLN